MRLTPRQQSILSCCQLDSRISALQIARSIKFREHTVVFGLRTLRTHGVISPYVFTNLHALGLTDYCVFFNYAGSGKNARSKILAFCCQSQRTAYVAELSGAFQFSVSIFARSIFEVHDFFTELSAIVPKGAISISFALRVEWSILPRKYFGKSPHPLQPLVRGKVPTQVEIDPVSARVLAKITAQPGQPASRIALELKMPETTFRYRVKQLEEKGIILGYPYEFSISRMGFIPFRILVIARQLTPRLRDLLFDLMLVHPQASSFVHCLGEWDFELGFDVTDLSQAGTILEELTDQHGEHIRETHMLTDLGVHKLHHFASAVLPLT